MLRRKVKSYRTSRLRILCGVFGCSIAGERLNDVCLCTTTMLS